MAKQATCRFCGNIFTGKGIGLNSVVCPDCQTMLKDSGYPATEEEFLTKKELERLQHRRTKCKEWRDNYKNTNGVDYNVNWKRNHKTEVSEYNKAYRLEHREEINERKRKYYWKGKNKQTKKSKSINKTHYLKMITELKQYI